MDVLVLERSGPLKGSVDASGAKNAALPIMAACLLTEDESVIEGVPRVTDVVTMTKILRTLGAEVEFDGGRLTVRPGTYNGWTAPYELVSVMRASICVLGPLLARHGRARVSLPGGCVIGPRPVDLHLKGLSALGATITIDHGDIVAQAEQLAGTTVHLSGAFGSSVLATANVMMAATLADGVTVIEHAACEPEVVDLAECLIRMGARMTGHGTPEIRIEGVPKLHGARHRIIADRIEAGTLMIAAAMLGGDVTVRGADARHLSALITKLMEAGASVEAAAASPAGSTSAPGGPPALAGRTPGGLRVRSDRSLRAVEVTTLPFPGFPTDLQAQLTAMLTVSQGASLVIEKIYPERFMHVPELRRMGAQITHEGSTAIIKGVERLSGAPVNATDLRGAAALVLAGLAADNRTVLRGVEHLDRGYDQLEQKLTRLGGKIYRQQE